MVVVETPSSALQKWRLRPSIYSVWSKHKWLVSVVFLLHRNLKKDHRSLSLFCSTPSNIFNVLLMRLVISISPKLTLLISSIVQTAGTNANTWHVCHSHRDHKLLPPLSNPITLLRFSLPVHVKLMLPFFPTDQKKTHRHHELDWLCQFFVKILANETSKTTFDLIILTQHVLWLCWNDYTVKVYVWSKCLLSSSVRAQLFSS